MQRKKGEGSYRKLPNSSYEFAIDVGNDIYGKRIRKRFYGSSESECRKKYKAFLKEGDKKPTQPKEHNLSSWIDEWLTVYKQGKCEDSTFRDYTYLANHVKEHKIGLMKLTVIKPIHITEYFSNKNEYSHSFIKRMKFLLNAAFETAIDNELIDRNPIRRAEIAKKTTPEKESYTETEAKIIEEFAKSDELFGVIMFIMLNSGIRAGEARALTVDKIDLDKGVIIIDKAVKKTGELGLPKNNKTRLIPLEDYVTEFLRVKLKGKTGYIVGGKEYHTTHSGFRGRYEWFFDRLNKHLEAKGENPITMRSPHAVRHTFASERTKRGMPVAILMELMGHSSREMTDHYTHVGDLRTLTEAVKKYSFSN